MMDFVIFGQSLDVGDKVMSKGMNQCKLDKKWWQTRWYHCEYRKKTIQEQAAWKALEEAEPSPKHPRLYYLNWLHSSL